MPLESPVKIKSLQSLYEVLPGAFRRLISNFKSWVRFSFGPSEDNIKLGLDRLEGMIKDAKKLG